MNTQQYARAEIHQINHLLASHRIDAGINPAGRNCMIAPQFLAYGIMLNVGEKVQRVIGLQEELAEVISQHRHADTPIRFQRRPLALEVPHPNPRPTGWRKASWTNPAHTMIAGRTFDLFHGAQELILPFQQHPHVLVAGSTGTGKSVLVQMLVASAAKSTDPADLHFWFADLKQEDLTPFATIPHVQEQATTPEQAQLLIALLDDEKRIRINTGQRSPRIVLVIDELAELRQDKASMEKVQSLLAVGRSLNLNLIISTQYPTAKVLGSLAKANLTTRLIGALPDANTANTATGRRDSGAQFLPRPGGFLFVHGSDMQRFQSFYVPPEEIPSFTRRLSP